MKILNLYAGIGGNRKLWSNCSVTAIEHRKDIADIYKHYFPKDNVIVADAHEYLLQHYNEFDFVWTSRPSTTHSIANFWASKTADNRKKYYPDFSLYEEIIFLKHWFDGLFVAENVIPYYKPLLLPDKILGRHIFWSNFKIKDFEVKDANIHKGKRQQWSELFGFDLNSHQLTSRKDQIYRNCVHPETGLHILNCALNKSVTKYSHQPDLFSIKV